MTHSIREATVADVDDVVRLLDAAMLEFDRERARRRVEAGSVLVAVVTGHNRDERRTDGHAGPDPPDERVVGACVLREPGPNSADIEGVNTAPTVIEQIAVHRSRRGRGIGSALVDAAATRTDGPLVARFSERVRPFYESLGFAIREAELDGACSERDDDGSTPEGGDAPSGDRLHGILR